MPSPTKEELMDWVDKAIELKKDYTWEDLPQALLEHTGELHSWQKVRAAVRRRMAKVDSPEREGTDQPVPKISLDNDVYTINANSKSRKPVHITRDTLRKLKELYCGSPPLTINQVCRRLNIPRRDFELIRTAFNITHDDVPFIDEDLIEREIEDLALETLEKRKDQYFTYLEELEIQRLRKENRKYKKSDYYFDIIHVAVDQHMKEFNKIYRGPKRRSVSEDGQYMLEVPIVDLHLGKLAWAPETGENYDYKIARQRYNYVIEDVIGRAKGRAIEKILFPISNDFFHYDTIDMTTTAGTPQDSDMRWPKMYSIGVEMLIRSIDELQEIAPVEVLLVPGNHDRMTGYYAIIYLFAGYRNDPDVKVYVDPKTRKYFEYGSSLIGFSHGDKEKGRIWGNMSVEAAKAWGRTKYREWHLAHEHSETVKEQDGIILRRLSSITGTDTWHADKGYVGAIIKQQCFLWHRDKGLYEIWNTPI